MILRAYHLLEAADGLQSFFTPGNIANISSVDGFLWPSPYCSATGKGGKLWIDVEGQQTALNTTGSPFFLVDVGNRRQGLTITRTSDYVPRVSQYLQKIETWYRLDTANSTKISDGALEVITCGSEVRLRFGSEIWTHQSETGWKFRGGPRQLFRKVTENVLGGHMTFNVTSAMAGSGEERVLKVLRIPNSVEGEILAPLDVGFFNYNQMKKPRACLGPVDEWGPRQDPIWIRLSC